MSNKDVVVIIGAGAIGRAIARRQGAGRAVLVADYNEHNLQSATAALEADGHAVTAETVDVSSRASVEALIKTATGLGNVVQVVNTAGLSPVQATAEAILRVDLYGTALFLEQFGTIIEPGGAGLVISSMAGYMLPRLDPEHDRLLAQTPTEDLLNLPMLSAAAVPGSGAAYAMSKHANHIQVEAASLAWGKRGARVNSISPGIVLTPLARDEMSGPGAAGYQAMLDKSPARRSGTVDEVASAAAYLLGPDAGFITGTDLRIDGGVIPAIKGGQITIQLS
ncbi:SDR family oxidoreductase [Mycobacterium sp.]|uniref:SDR family oxidoreductase n=1 Tax=Mycobacterium sp. TaxID=1785 RepID=UPI003BAFC7DD